MPQHIRCFDNQNKPVVNAGESITGLIYFNLLRLNKGEQAIEQVANFELVAVVLKGNCDIEVNSERFADVGRREDIWSGKADSVYAGSGATVVLTANTDGTEVAVAGGYCKESYRAFRVAPEDVDMVDVGSNETKSRRRIFHILGNKHGGKAGNLLVSELFCDEGCWSGYPAHKHDTDTLPEETNHQELYHYRFNPGNGFGGQIVFQPDGESECYMTRNGDTVLIDKGYHPTVTSPGHQEYIFTILVGGSQRPLIQNFKDDYRYLMDKIPGIGAMRAAFK